MYCALTGQLIGVGVHAVKKHMEGKRFQKAKGTDRNLVYSDFYAGFRFRGFHARIVEAETRARHSGHHRTSLSAQALI